MPKILSVFTLLSLTFAMNCSENTVTPDTSQDRDSNQWQRTRVEEKDQISINNMNSDMPWNSQYTLGPDSQSQDGVPNGEVIKGHFVSSEVYPGVERDYWLYIPKQYNASRPACLMVFQDGEMYLAPEINVPAVFDNLIHKGEIPVMIGLFVNPGDKGPGTPIMGGNDNRSNEYNSLGDRYASFLIDELLPAVQKDYAIVGDPEGHAICGMSAGGICAFTVAWERPDVFGKVISHCGSFVNIQGGHNYPSMIRGTKRKSIRVFLQSGTHDLDFVFGNWPLANQQMAKALEYRDYDYRFVFGEGGHSIKHGGSIFPDTLRWLWRDYPSSLANTK